MAKLPLGVSGQHGRNARIVFAVALMEGMHVLRGEDVRYVLDLPVPPRVLIDYARSVMPRELTPEQRRQYFLE